MYETTVEYGENGGCEGYLIGNPRDGIKIMFDIMEIIMKHNTGIKQTFRIGPQTCGMLYDDKCTVDMITKIVWLEDRQEKGV